MPLHETNYLLPLALYAETHFRFFRWMPSFLYKRFPEVLFDCPRRINPGADLPITLIINDTKGEIYNVNRVAITLNRIGEKPSLHEFSDISSFEVDHDLKHNQKVYCITLKRAVVPDGPVFINCKATLHYKKRTVDIFNDNFVTSSKAPFSCFVSSEFLPGHNSCLYGDMHFHSQYSQSHVEFGPPFDVIDKTAEASGLAFVAITDHSYDLCCDMDNYLREDPLLKRWASLQTQFEKPFATTFLPGEEISCLNSSGNVIHLCGIGIREYISGSMDGARRKKLFGPGFSIGDTVRAIQKQNGIAFAAHPGSKKTFMQYVFLNRGIWTERDICENDITAVQAFNGSFKPAWSRGKQLWVDALIKGRRYALIAGNDAHGDFNRYRAIKVPFVSILENDKRFMGFGKTGVYTHDRSQANIIDCIRKGQTFITTGPYLNICSSKDPNDSLIVLDTIPQTITTLYLLAQSTVEFGPVESLRLIAHFHGATSEQTLFTKTYTTDQYQVVETFEIPGKLTDRVSGDMTTGGTEATSDAPRLHYIRLEVVSVAADGSVYEAYSGACFVGDS